MRIDRLDLRRFGRFTGLTIPFPTAPQDFHVVVGPNEAGKSTIRAAIIDLFFGIEKSSSYDFVHPKPELCIGARLSDGEQHLEFSRLKKARSLVDASGTPLPEDTLAPFLGGANRTFFRQMFGLDHERLVTGGQEMLDGSDDVGRILFQTATGIGNLGPLREALEKEASELWAPRRASGRAYYVAADTLAEADAELNRTLVKAKDWTDARELANTVSQELERTRAHYQTLEKGRCRLERLRRVAPHVRRHAECEAELAALGQVAVLPADATNRLAEVETTMAAASTLLTQARQRLEELRTTRSAIMLDGPALRQADRIEALAERKQQTFLHTRDIGKREVEIAAHWATIKYAQRQLGWAIDDETQLHTKLPPLPLRRTLRSLLARHGALHKAAEATSDAARAKHREVVTTEQELSRQAGVDTPPELIAALDAARRLGDVDAALKRESAKVNKARAELRVAGTHLGAWRPTRELLDAALPPMEVTRKLRRDHERLETDVRSAIDRCKELERDLAAAELAADQYRHSHRAPTVEELTAARQARDTTWSEIRGGTRTITDTAPEFERLIDSADHIADERHDKAQEAAELQSKLDHVSQLCLRRQQAEEHRTSLAAQLAVVDSEWRALSQSIGFPDMPIFAHEDWRNALSQFRLAYGRFTSAEADVSTLQSSSQSATQRLRRALGDTNDSTTDDASLDVYVTRATSLINDAVAERARRAELTRQLATARLALSDLEERQAQAHSSLEQWQLQWTQAIAQAELSGAELGAVDGALSLFDELDDKLKAIRELRESRIQTMQRDLEDFDREAKALTIELAPELVARPARDVSTELSARLSRAIEAQRELERIDAELRRYETQQELAEADLDRARGILTPWMELAAVKDIDALRAAIVRSDKWRKARDTADEAKAAAENAGEGLGLATLAQQVNEADLDLVAPRLTALTEEQRRNSELQGELSAKLALAQTNMERIAGQDDAARAAARRQEALAKMADAAERFIKVHVASRLLRFAIDRYRETRQGPLLAQASETFCTLTRGSFVKLTVEFDSEPPTLIGLRANGRAVTVPMMSDGTRDQLYLALRLAALKLHVNSGHPLPFVADDLFVNFDDERASAGLEALAELSRITQVIFLTHHQHLVPTIQRVFGAAVNIASLRENQTAPD